MKKISNTKESKNYIIKRTRMKIKIKNKLEEKQKTTIRGLLD